MARNSKVAIAEILVTLVPRDSAAAGGQHLRRDLSSRLNGEVGEDEMEGV